MRKAEFAAAARAQAAHTAPKFEGTSEIQEIKVIGDWAFSWTQACGGRNAARRLA